ncbi:Transcriptional activator protein LuxR [hydrothermal vent metagenome]|uniref:Transcriptional activator protein LuxR n=1 Tax=hydrothermal vent metagenome TaxID=652676 RepID=A0A3B0Z2R8_9ZZZZ
MSSSDFDFIDTVSRADSVDALHAVCADLCEDYGFDRFIYGARIPTSFVKPYFIFISGYPKEWRDHYTRKNYMIVDPTVEYCARSVTPLCWDGKSELGTGTPEVQRFMSEAHDFGLNSGVSFPLHTAQGDFAMLSFASEKLGVSTPSLQRVLPIGQLFTAYLHESVRRVFASDVLTLSKVDLTGREKECLLWATEGKTAWETSQILSIAERTVTFHLQNVQHKLGVNNRQQAVARAVSLGIIEPQFG